MDKTSSRNNTPMWRSKLGRERDTSPISDKRTDTTGSAFDGRIDDLLKAIPTKGGISREVVLGLKAEFLKMIEESSAKGAVEVAVSPGTASKTYSAGEITDVVAAVGRELVPVMTKHYKKTQQAWLAS